MSEQELVRCKPCGYVCRKDALRGVCPACGASLSAFEPYEDRVSARRRYILSLDLHPIVVHAPQTFAVLLPALLLFHMLFPKLYRAEILTVASFTALILPVVSAGAFLTGLIDGRVKFKRLKAPLLIRKIVLGGLFLVVSAVNAAVVGLYGLCEGTQLAVLSLAVILLAAAVSLGMSGKKLILPILPGR